MSSALERLQLLEQQHFAIQTARNDKGRFFEVLLPQMQFGRTLEPVTDTSTITSADERPLHIPHVTGIGRALVSHATVLVGSVDRGAQLVSMESEVYVGEGVGTIWLGSGSTAHIHRAIDIDLRVGSQNARGPVWASVHTALGGRYAAVASNAYSSLLCIENMNHGAIEVDGPLAAVQIHRPMHPAEVSLNARNNGLIFVHYPEGAELVSDAARTHRHRNAIVPYSEENYEGVRMPIGGSLYFVPLLSLGGEPVGTLMDSAAFEYPRLVGVVRASDTPEDASERLLGSVHHWLRNDQGTKGSVDIQHIRAVLETWHTLLR